MLSRSNVCSRCNKWSGEDFLHGGLPAFAIDDPLHIDITSLSHDARDFLQANDSKLVSVVTMGDGACGVHSVFGTFSEWRFIQGGCPTFGGKLIGPKARGF